MFFRTKKSGPRRYLQIVENRREGTRIKQRVIATLGRVDELQASGRLESLLRSGARLADQVLLLSAHEHGELTTINTRRIGSVKIFERLWQETGCAAVVKELLRCRQFELPMERAIFMTVLHRLLVSGSDRAAARWCGNYAIAEVDGVHLHHLYRAMAWLGEALPDGEHEAATPWSPRCVKDQFEEALFAHRRDLFSDVEVVFFATTSIYFEGAGGDTLGQYGYSKDHRSDRKQMVVGLVVDNAGRPLCCELWPGNVTDAKTLIPLVDRLRQRFAIRRVCIVADRGMLSAQTLAALDGDARAWPYILGARMRRQREVTHSVLARGGRYRVVRESGTRANDPSPLKVKEVWVERRRYVVCCNDEQARKDAASRAAIVQALREQLKRGDKALVGNKGYRRYLAVEGQRFHLDEAKIAADARYDGKWVLRTNTDLDTAEVALKYQQLWQVEALFRATKSLLDTRPIFHKRDETIRGHIFCSFLALVLRKELQDRLSACGHAIEWAQLIDDLEALQEIDVVHQQKHFRLRTDVRGSCGKVFQAVGVALPPTVRPITEVASA